MFIAQCLIGELFVADITVPPVVYERVGAPHGSPSGRSTIVRVVTS